MNADTQTKQLINAVLSEIESDPDLIARLRAVLGLKAPRTAINGGRRARRRPPSAFEPFAIYSEGGEAALRARLEELDLERLKDMIAEHGMDPAKLAMKWRTSDRLIDLIVTTTRERAHKGDAFRTNVSD